MLQTGVMKRWTVLLKLGDCPEWIPNFSDQLSL